MAARLRKRCRHSHDRRPIAVHVEPGYAAGLDPATGKTLWKTDVGGPMTNAPITYEWAGRQYVIIGARNTLTGLALPTGG